MRDRYNQRRHEQSHRLTFHDVARRPIDQPRDFYHFGMFLTQPLEVPEFLARVLCHPYRAYVRVSGGEPEYWDSGWVPSTWTTCLEEMAEYLQGAIDPTPFIGIGTPPTQEKCRAFQKLTQWVQTPEALSYIIRELSQPRASLT